MSGITRTGVRLRDTVDIKAVLPTLPSLPAVQSSVDRAGLLAGLGFLEAVAQSSCEQNLALWLNTVTERFGWRELPASVGEPGAGAVLLQTSAAVDGVPQLVIVARDVVVKALRGFLAGDDRFLQSALFAGRVRRDAGASDWVARPREADALSDIVLSLFAADILAFREFHDQALCVCEICGRASFNPKITTRLGCIEHLGGSDRRTAPPARSSSPDAEPSAITWSTR